MRARVPTPGSRNGRLILLALLLAAVGPAGAAAQTIDRGRERDVLQLVAPFVDEGPVGESRLARVAIRAEAITLELQDAAGRTARLVLRPRAAGQVAPGTLSFVVESPPAPTPQLAADREQLRVAVAKNDDGRFFASTKRAAAGPAPETTLLRFRLAEVLWAALLLLLLLTMAAVRRQGHARWSAAVLGFLALAALAAAVRRALPFAPLHANGHGLEELAVALDWPGARLATERFVSQYGASWLLPLRVLTRLTGQNHDQLAAISAGLGGLAVAFSGAAAWRASRHWPWTVLATLVVLLAPVAARVAHSESAFVVAQLLMALGLFLATWHGLLARLALALCLALLTLGHPVGIVAATGLGMLAWALALRQETPRLQALLPLLATALVAPALLQFAGGHADVASRLTEGSGLHLPVPTAFYRFWLWADRDHAPVAASLGALLGLAAFDRGSAVPLRFLPAGLAAIGAALVLIAGLLVTACISDGLRYQALWAPVLCLLLAHAGRGLRDVTLGPLLAIALWLAVAWGLTGLDRGRQLDAQGQAYQALRAHLASAPADIWLIHGDRSADRNQVVVELPVARLRAGGPSVHALAVTDVAARCARGQELLPHTFFWQSDACSALQRPGEPLPCAELAAVAAAPSWSVRLFPQGPIASPGMPGEFQRFRDASPRTALYPVRCP